MRHLLPKTALLLTLLSGAVLFAQAAADRDEAKRYDAPSFTNSDTPQVPLTIVVPRRRGEAITGADVWHVRFAADLSTIDCDRRRYALDGLTDFATKTITLRSGQSQAALLDTLIHELLHVAYGKGEPCAAKGQHVEQFILAVTPRLLDITIFNPDLYSFLIKSAKAQWDSRENGAPAPK